MYSFECPYVDGFVELSDERVAHIASKHPELLPDRIDAIADTLYFAEEVRLSTLSAATRMFLRWYDDLVNGKYVVVVVVTDHDPERHWIVTAYVTGKVTGGIRE